MTKNVTAENPEKPAFKKRPFKRHVDRKATKQILKEKRARLVIRNLPFKVTEEIIREHFGQYGEIANIELLKKPDGKLVGCAFVQFKLVQSARKAQHYANNQPILGRKIQIDSAKCKKTYLKEKRKKEIEAKKLLKQETAKLEVKTEDECDEEIEDKKEVITIPDDNNDDEDVKILSEQSDSEGSESDESDEIKKSNKMELDNEDSSSTTVKKPFMSHDVKDGKTVFIKNVPFDATNEDVKKVMSQYGPLYYALICMDKLTNHSRGTAFVKYVNKEDAETALKAGTELKLLGNILDCHPAIDREELKNKENMIKESKSIPKDSRNLYLVKEGVILAGSKAAEGVSASDMEKRLKIEQYKTQILRNLNTFVARDRLVVHNLPPSWDDAKFKMLMQKHGGKDAVVKEARIMRDMRNLDANGIGVSKQYGFAAFKTHESALTALRSLNNNPNIFSKHKRPIITFSIENKTAINAKLKRQHNSKVKNPKSKSYDATSVAESIKSKMEESKNSEELKPFAGVTAKEGQIQKMRSRYKLNVQAKIHHENLKKEKKKQKIAKELLKHRRKQCAKEPRMKSKKKVGIDDNFSKMVNNYKKILNEGNEKAKTKWYQE